MEVSERLVFQIVRLIKKTKMFKNWIAKNIYQNYEVSPFSSVFAQICLSQANCLIIITTTDRQNISPCLFCNVSVQTDALLCGQYIVAVCILQIDQQMRIKRSLSIIKRQSETLTNE